MAKQMLGVDSEIDSVELIEVEKHRVHFVWGSNMWEQIWLPEHECNPEGIQLIKGMIGKLVQYQGKHYKAYKFVWGEIYGKV